MKTQELINQIFIKKSFLCIGLDPDMTKIPQHLLNDEDPIFSFNKAIIDATHDLAVAYKPNIAFYEAYGIKGWQSLEKTIQYLNSNYPEIFTIADAKRGDIGNTSAMYAQAFLENLGFDSITVAPYMGKDSVEPFLSFENKHTILLALTSNAGASDFNKGVEILILYPSRFPVLSLIGPHGTSLPVTGHIKTNNDSSQANDFIELNLLYILSK